MPKFLISPRWGQFFSQSPLHFADIGAAEGLQTKWVSIQKYLRAFLFEPDARSVQELEQGGGSLSVIPSALGGEAGQKTLFLSRKPTCSSLYPPNMDFLADYPDPERYETVQALILDVVTLDELQARSEIPRLDFLKLDVQGYELEILKGAQHLLKDQVLGIEVEVEFMPLYKDQPLFSDVHNFLTAHGFDLFDMRFYYWKRKGPVHTSQPKGQIIGADGVYFRRPAHIMETIRRSERDEARRLVIHSSCLLGWYGYLDSAWAILHCRNDLFDEFEQRDIVKYFAPANRLRRFFARHKIHNALMRLAAYFDPGCRGYFKVT